VPVNELLVRILDHTPASIAERVGPTSVAGRLLRGPVNRLLPEGSATVGVRSGPARGVRLEIDPRREKFYWSGAYEPSVQRAFVEVLTTGAVCWDIGAHIGFFALLASRLVGSSGHVHALEPMPANRQRLMRNLSLNDVENVSVHDFALSSDSGNALLRSNQSSSTWSLIEGGDDGVSVPVSTLDALLDELAAPDLVKIDVEGAEVDVLRGGRRLLIESRPRLIVEYSSETSVEAARGLFDGYETTALTAGHLLHIPNIPASRPCSSESRVSS
jgi:FkbM family methyltransferase